MCVDADLTAHSQSRPSNHRPPIIEQIVEQEDLELPDLPTSLPPLPPNGRSRSINRLTHSSIEVTTVLDNKTTVTGITVRSESADRFSMSVDYPSTQPPLTPEESIEEDALNEEPIEPVKTKKIIQESVLAKKIIQEPALTNQNVQEPVLTEKIHQEPVLVKESVQEPVQTVAEEIPESFVTSSSFSEDIYDLNNIEYNRKFNSKRKPNIIECADPEVGLVAQESPIVPQVELVAQTPSPVDPKDFFVKSFIKPLADEAEHNFKGLKKPMFKPNQLLNEVSVAEQPKEFVKPTSLELDNTKPNFKKTQLLNRLKKPSLSQVAEPKPAIIQPAVDVEAKKPSFKQSLIVNKAAKPVEPLSKESRSASRSDILVVDAAPNTIDIDFDAYEEKPAAQLQSFPTLTNLISNLNIKNDNEVNQSRGGNIKKFFGDWNSLLNDEEEIGIVASPLKGRLDTGAEADIDEDIVKEELNRLKIVKPITNTNQLSNLRQLQLQQFQRKQQELERQQVKNQVTNQVSHSGSNVDVTVMNLIRNLRSKFKNRHLAGQDAAFHNDQGQQQQHNHQGHHAPAGQEDELVDSVLFWPSCSG